MKRNKPGTMREITREEYKTVKKYDRQEFTTFCRELYASGFKDGQESVPGLDIEQIYAVIAQTKGIGEKKLAQIRANIDAAYGSKAAGEAVPS